MRARSRQAWARGAMLAAAVALFAPGANAATAFDDVVAPIFQARCASCHGETKKKGRLALHTWEAVAKGGDSGPLFVAGKPEESELVRRLRLPLDDEEHMPPSDEEQLSPDEIALLERWIAAGASHTATLEELKLSPALATAAKELRQKLPSAEATAAEAEAKSEAFWHLNPVEVAKRRAPLAEKVAELQRWFPGALSYESRTSAALHFTAAGLGRDFGDKQLAEIAVLRDELVLLDLSGTSVTDAAAETLAQFGKLKVLRASFTELGDRAVAALSLLPALESVTLHATKITAGSVEPLRKLRNLRALRLGATPAEAAAQAAKLPVVVVGFAEVAETVETAAESRE